MFQTQEQLALKSTGELSPLKVRYRITRYVLYQFFRASVGWVQRFSLLDKGFLITILCCE